MAFLADGDYCEFQLTGVKPKFLKRKRDGDKYSVEFEVTKEDWEQFTVLPYGSIVAAGMKIVEMPMAVRNETPAQKAKRLCMRADFQKFADIHGFSEAKEYLYYHCGIKSRGELDTEPEKAKAFEDIVRDWQKWRRGL